MRHRLADVKKTSADFRAAGFGDVSVTPYIHTQVTMDGAGLGLELQLGSERDKLRHLVLHQTGRLQG